MSIKEKYIDKVILYLKNIENDFYRNDLTMFYTENEKELNL